ncbi:hypothetical protein FA95DRAFT_1614054 [Auriscalpium vulgare]|uniref:Uncharacterized protein n=1 Tax=Auriscalpium vulgare TaxID=40419 RepID=A0ACB8R160_9AGAM|nr:hypothetical protein FA95DRAFT_1614054 [Auriscalpium vulgare]
MAKTRTNLQRTTRSARTSTTVRSGRRADPLFTPSPPRPGALTRAPTAAHAAQLAAASHTPAVIGSSPNTPFPTGALTGAPTAAHASQLTAASHTPTVIVGSSPNVIVGSSPNDLGSNPRPPRFDPIFGARKIQQQGANFLSSFVDADQPLQVCPYPAYDDGTRVPPANLKAYFKSHDWPMPFCFCKLRDGVNHTCRFIVVGPMGGENAGDPCIVCPTRQVPLLVMNCREKLEENPNIPSKKYPWRSPAVSDSVPLNGGVVPERFPSLSPLTWSSLPPSSQPGPAPAGIVRNATPGPSNQKGGTQAADDDERSSSMVEVDIPGVLAPSMALVDVREDSIPPLPYFEEPLYEEPLDLLEPLDLPESPSGNGLASHIFSSTAAQGSWFIDDMSRLWSPPPEHLSYQLADQVEPLPDDEADILVRALNREDNPGIHFHDLIRLLAKCTRCKLIMTPNRLETHTCRIPACTQPTCICACHDTGPTRAAQAVPPPPVPAEPSAPRNVDRPRNVGGATGPSRAAQAQALPPPVAAQALPFPVPAQPSAARAIRPLKHAHAEVLSLSTPSNRRAPLRPLKRTYAEVFSPPNQHASQESSSSAGVIMLKGPKVKRRMVNIRGERPVVKAADRKGKGRAVEDQVEVIDVRGGRSRAKVADRKGKGKAVPQDEGVIEITDSE